MARELSLAVVVQPLGLCLASKEGTERSSILISRWSTASLWARSGQSSQSNQTLVDLHEVAKVSMLMSLDEP